jgi:hypothetical protein
MLHANLSREAQKLAIAIELRTCSGVSIAGNKESNMTRFLCAAAAAIAVLGFAQGPAAASEAPWCAVYGLGENGEIWECQYRSVEECVPHVTSGNRGFCNPNPRFQTVQQPARKRSVHGHSRQRRQPS